MLDFLRWSRIKTDAPPGTLVYAGDAPEFTPYVLHYAYNAETLDEHRSDSAAKIILVDGCVNLLLVVGVHHTDIVRDIGRDFGVPPLYLEDVLNTGQRAKFAWADERTGFMVMKHLEFESGRIRSEQVSLLWRDDAVVVFLERESDLLDGLIGRLKRGKGRLRRSGSDYLLMAVLDAIVDNHILTLADFSDAAQDLENRLDDNLSDQLLGELYELKREAIVTRNLLLPMREVFKGLTREEAEVGDEVLPFMEDVAGHFDQALESATSLHDILKSMIDYQISLIGIRTNKVMQLLTVIATIFIPLTFIAGLYGMNFENMPELKWRYGYVASLALMGVVAVGMWLFFRRKRFL